MYHKTNIPYLPRTSPYNRNGNGRLKSCEPVSRLLSGADRQIAPADPAYLSKN